MEEVRQTNQNIRKRNKQPSLFPKLNKLQVTPLDHRPIGKTMGKKYAAESIFKAKPQKSQVKCLKLAIDQQCVMRSKQYQQIEAEINQSRRRHIQQMNHLDKLIEDKNKQIQAKKKESYKTKLSLWELKNEILEMSTTWTEQQDIYQKLMQDLGYQEQDAEDSQIKLNQQGNKQNQSSEKGYQENEENSLKNNQQIEN